MPRNLQTIEYDEDLPASVEVVVIGGGVAGISTALSLAEKGVSVAVCEKGEVAAEQSSRNWGWTRVMGRDKREIPLAIESLKLWRDMDRRVGAQTGFQQGGTMWLADTRAQLDTYEEWLEHAREWQLDSRLLDAEGVAELLPGMTRRFVGALYTPSDGRAEPLRAVPAMATAARRLGVKVFRRCAVRGVETKAGNVSGVVTERGRIACSAAVLAGGAWSRLFCGNLDLFLPQLKIMGSVLRTEPMEGPEIAVGAGTFAFRKRTDGGYTVARRNGNIADVTPDSFRLLRDFLPGLRTTWREVRLRAGSRFFEEWRTKRRWSLDEASPFEAVRVLDPEPSQAKLDEAVRELKQAYPAFQGMRVAETWGGMIDVTPDAVPVISPVRGLPGFYVATGFSGHGFGIGPGAGRLMADLVTGDTPIVDPAPYAFERFRPHIHAKGGRA
jgi:glycine/D-amino acid oxidase-like deaminating enzyme